MEEEARISAAKSEVKIVHANVKAGAEAGLNSQAWLQAMMSCMDDLVFVFDEAQRFIFCNQQGEGSELFRDRDQFMGKRHSEVMPAHIHAPFLSAFDRARDGAVTEFDYSLEMGGVNKWFSARLSPLKINEEFAGAVAVIRDVTAIQRMQRALHDSQEAFRSIVETSRDGILVTDPSGRICYANPAVARLLLREKDELIGDKFDYQIPVRATEEVTIYSDDETPGSAEMTSQSTTWGGQEAYLVTLHDVSSRKLLEDRLVQAQKMEAIGRLAGGVAHDFNNLLTSVLGYGRLILDEIEEDNPIRPDLEEIVHSGERAASLTRQLLTFSRRQHIKVRPLDLNVIVRDMHKLLRRTLGEDIEVVTVLCDEPCVIDADPGRIEQIILNLALNARDAMADGGKVIIQTAHDDAAVEASDADAGSMVDQVVLSVSDTGCGIDDQLKDRLFEPFFSTKGEKGTGLGLSTVYGLVGQFHGSIDVRSHVGEGTEFRLSFPLSETSSEDISMEATSDVLEKLPHGDETILVVEDEETVRRLTVRILEALGYDVICARHGSVAYDLVREYDGTIDLVITDIIMPQMDGPDLIRKLRGLRDDFKTIYMSGFTSDKLDGLKLESDGIPLMQKPFSRKELAATVRAVLDSSAT